ncbi:TIGR03089 family protein [Nesterenkonia lacusekhoensis]|uniref:Uncharacterized protein (TIGR03089 family) n=1 Tax=Nesterenkonia lacusekhoensis TaxID=150832 RepID=A0ABS4SZE2_9MICC|nr:TIGR03089 family protein [Nesterenkonia lacusekhoensis]MBP2317518.1 uncharacterized protein (TIGR03089 family) [Nesterenkonia lacusekhoensis]
MTPLTLGSASQNVPEDFPQLLELLAGRPQPAVVCYRPRGADGEVGAEPDSTDPDGTEPERVELSGRVLQNWAVKLIGLFTEELEEIFDPAEPTPRVLVDSAPHWKSAAVVLAASSLGAQVVTAAGATDSSGTASLAVTDRPQDWQSSPALGQAELAALSPGLLDESFEDAVGQAIPAWVLDISAEVRQHPDQLLTPLEPVRLPEGVESGGIGTGGAGAGGTALVTRTEWAADAVGALLSTWAHGGTVVLIDGMPEDPVWGQGRWEQALRNEGLA